MHKDTNYCYDKKWEKFLLGSKRISLILKDPSKNFNIGFWKWDAKTRVLLWSSGIFRILDLAVTTDGPYLGLYLYMIPEKERHEFITKINDAAGEPEFAIEHQVVTGKGSIKTLKVYGIWYTYYPSGNKYCYGIVQDVTNKKINSFLNNFPVEIFDNDLIGVTINDSEHNIRYSNNAFTNITGYTKEEISGQCPETLRLDRYDVELYRKITEGLAIYGKWQGKKRSIKKSGESYLLWRAINTIRDRNSDPIGFLNFFIDLTMLGGKESEPAEYTRSDMLTGCGNREKFFANLDNEIGKAENDHSRFAVVVFNINRFRYVNKSLGYSMGDRLLQLVAGRIRELLSPQDFLARFSGSNFYILITHLKGKDVLDIKATQLIDKFREPFLISEKNYFLSASIGIATYPEDGETCDALMGRAEQALRKAEKGGTNNYALFSSYPSAEMSDYAGIENQLRAALENPDRELRAKFQPKMRLSTGGISTVEALVRWEHPTRGLLPPLEFINIAEETGLIVPIDMWMFKEACRLSVEWEKLLGIPITIAVNFSSKQYHRKDFLPKIKGIIDSTGAKPGNLGIEITETGIMTDFHEASSILSNLKKIGFTIFIDDFGTGYSSLAYLRKLPVDAIKIDKSFIEDILTNTQAATLVKTIIVMAHSLNMEVVAEGVETPEQKAFLAKNGCDLIQGYLISPPVAPDSIIGFLESWKGNKSLLRQRNLLEVKTDRVKKGNKNQNVHFCGNNE